MKWVKFVQLLSLICLASCSSPVPHLDSPGTTIVCFGDSITAGVGGGGVTYPKLLAQSLGTTVINAGIPGETSVDGSRRIAEILDEDPWLVIIEFGGNDLLQKLPRKKTEAALRDIIETLLEAQIVPVLVEIHNPLSRGYAKLFDDLAEDYSIPMVEGVLSKILLTPRLKSDPIHPNADGYRQLAQEIAEVVQPLIEKRHKI